MTPRLVLAALLASAPAAIGAQIEPLPRNPIALINANVVKWLTAPFGETSMSYCAAVELIPSGTPFPST